MGRSLAIVRVALAASLTSALPAHAQPDTQWTSWRVGALVRALAVQGDAIWIGTTNGVMKFHIPTEKNRVYSTKDGLLSNVVLGITIAPDNAVWIGTYGGGLTRFDGKTKWTTYTPYGAGTTGDYRAPYQRYQRGEGIGDLWVYQSMFTPDGTLWAATWKGASRFNGNTFTTYSTGDGLIDKWVYSMAMDRDKRFWFGTEGGVTMFDGRRWTSWTHQDGLGADLPRASDNPAPTAPSPHHEQSEKAVVSDYNPNYVLATVIDHAQNKWFGTWGGGLTRFDGKHWVTYTTQDGLAGNVVGALAFDRKGVLWIGTDAGVSRMDPAACTAVGSGRKPVCRFTKFTTFDGLFHDAVYAVAIDAAGAKWFGTYGGVSRYTGH
ncbi:MAG: ligand-binding sensor domain-containing protein [Nitrospirota bacterium]